MDFITELGVNIFFNIDCQSNTSRINLMSNHIDKINENHRSLSDHSSN